MKNMFRPALFLAAGTLALASCKKDDETTPATPVTAQTVSDLSAAGTTSSTGQPVAAKHYTFYSLADNKPVAYTDSNSTKWDVAFRGTTILINAGSSGPGQGGAQVYGLQATDNLTFAQIVTAPTTGYAVDAVATKAIVTGSGNGWYSYSSTTNVVTPTAGRTLLIRTALGKYAKMEILSYYQGAPSAPTSASPSGYYKFRYVYQPSGTTLQ